jgi:Right handed beta helix region
MRPQLPLTVIATALACSLATAPAHAQRARDFVASYGNDSNPCSFTQPCRTFQHAHDVVLAGGEVTAIDSAGFGPISITKAITISSPAGIEAGIVPNAGADAIDINVGPSDAIVLRGLTLDGAGTGHNGIVFSAGGSLTVTDCTLQNFAFDGSNLTTGNGILMQPTGGTLAFTITNTTASNNGATGILFLTSGGGSPSANGVIDHVVADANHFDGISVDARFTSVGTIVVTVSDSIASNNGSQGIFAGNGSSTLKVSIDNVTVGGNSFGIVASPPANVLLGRSVITGNGTGVSNSTIPNTLYTYGNNQINLNTTDIAGTALNTTLTPR